VVVDARMVSDGGIGTYLQALVPRIAALHTDWRFCALGDVRAMRSLGWGALANVTLGSCRAPIFSVREQLEVPWSYGSADLFWAPNYNVSAFVRLPLVATIHDVNHLALPDLLGGIVRQTYARRMISSTFRRARRILFVSEFTRRETQRLLGHPCTHATVVHSGVDAAWSDPKLAASERPLQEPYFLYVGNIKRHKNVPGLLRAFNEVASVLPHRLVLIGRTEGLRADSEVSAMLPELNGRALMLGEVPADTLRRYVAHADALVTASLYEGFGLPALEAMAAGCPCVVSNAGSLPEICGDAALYCDPHDERSISAALRRVSETPQLRIDLVARGRARAAQFSWDRSARLTAEVLEQALT
jgi:glycosyltransferase involved in cell wall biosynthesis